MARKRKKRVKRKNIYNNDILSQSYRPNNPLVQKKQLKKHFDIIGYKPLNSINLEPSNKFIDRFEIGYSEYLTLIWDYNNGILPIWKMERLNELILKFKKNREVIIKNV